ncbi:hypothetical protein [Salsipaludibacter albus]|uniref:hypothetical protein n=1 Tax=Salsipaludibacter albus TaxID=2849650 RepID=UPI001EE4C03A|nr:hypothetical protein [Salsipaludibacter albus]MBY5163135.1 hypothetical protein [Salsipaludibacter albus]
MLLADGTTIAVEVTTCIDEEAAEFEAARDRHGVHVDVEGLVQSWAVRLTESTRLDGLIEVIAPHLAELERHGVDGLGRPARSDSSLYIRHRAGDPGGAVPPVAYELLDLGVDTAWAFARTDGRQSVEFIRRSGGGSGNTEHLVTEEVTRAAVRKSPVLSRPAAQRADRRHLFVWLDPDWCREAEFGLWSGNPAFAPPLDFAPGIDEIWVGSWSATPGEGIGYVVLWHANHPSAAWRHPTPPELGPNP